MKEQYARRKRWYGNDASVLSILSRKLRMQYAQGLSHSIHTHIHTHAVLCNPSVNIEIVWVLPTKTPTNNRRRAKQPEIEMEEKIIGKMDQDEQIVTKQTLLFNSLR